MIYHLRFATGSAADAFFDRFDAELNEYSDWNWVCRVPDSVNVENGVIQGFNIYSVIGSDTELATEMAVYLTRVEPSLTDKRYLGEALAKVSKNRWRNDSLRALPKDGRGERWPPERGKDMGAEECYPEAIRRMDSTGSSSGAAAREAAAGGTMLLLIAAQWGDFQQRACSCSACRRAWGR